jgi:hypothetical protein
MRVSRVFFSIAFAMSVFLAAFAVPAAAQVTCAGVAAWTDCCGCTYTQGQPVTYNNSRYHAVQTFKNSCGAGWNPGAVSSLWALDGSCSSARATATATATRTPTPTRPRQTATATTARATATPTSTNAPTATPSGAPPAPHVNVSPGVSGCVDQPTPCRLYWAAVPNASSYRVYAGGTSPIATITETQYFSIMFGRGFWVTSVAGGLESARSNSVLCTAYVADCIPCTTYPTWSPGVVYNAGANVSYNQHFWRAQASTINEQPGVAPVWALVGRCG